MHAVATSNGTQWAFAWQELAAAAGAEHADALLADLTGFVTCVDRTRERMIEVLPAGCPGLCRDECLAISIVTASQIGSCPALKACLFALLGSCNVEPGMLAAQVLGQRLSAVGATLAPHLVCNAAAIVADKSGSRH